MKLYTEEQVKRAMLEYSSYSKPTMIQVIDTLKPIELPSDDEIEKECNKLPFEKHVDCGMYNDGQIDGFELGAKWMKEQILGKEDKTFKKKSQWTEVDNMTRRLK